MDGVVEVVTPDSIQSAASLVERADHLRVILVGLSNQANFSAKLSSQCPYVFCYLGKNVFSRVVFDRLHCVKTKAVEMIFANPVKRVLYEVATNTLASRLVIVDGVAPGCFVSVGEVWAEQTEVIAFVPQVVV